MAGTGEKPKGEPRPELVFALCAPLGTRLEALQKRLTDYLAVFGYTSVEIRLSKLIANFPGWKPLLGRSEEERIARFQKGANDLRRSVEDASVLARAGIHAIRQRRGEITGDPDKQAHGHAFIIYQVKHPEEVRLLRQTYGSSFLLIAGNADRNRRNEELARVLAESAGRPDQATQSHGQASILIETDQSGGGEFAQNMRDTFPLADVFIDMNTTSGELGIDRFVDLIFGHPFHSPRPHEYAMYQASAASLRSADFNRQVGAAIVQLQYDDSGFVRSADVVSLGMNEVPKRGGGYYWGEGSPDRRDQYLDQSGDDRPSKLKESMLGEIFERLQGAGILGGGVENREAMDLAKEYLPVLAKTRFSNISEFSRPVHAEMSAIIDAARRGVSVAGHSMFVTTFPCHNCAKHIIAAGIRNVVYLEPYPKSKADVLYREELSLDPSKTPEYKGAVEFGAYAGVAPRQYRLLFGMGERGAQRGLTIDKWTSGKNSIGPLYVREHLFEANKKAEIESTAPLERFGFDPS